MKTIWLFVIGAVIGILIGGSWAFAMAKEYYSTSVHTTNLTNELARIPPPPSPSREYAGLERGADETMTVIDRWVRETGRNCMLLDGEYEVCREYKLPFPIFALELWRCREDFCGLSVRQVSERVFAECGPGAVYKEGGCGE